MSALPCQHVGVNHPKMMSASTSRKCSGGHGSICVGPRTLSRFGDVIFLSAMTSDCIPAGSIKKVSCCDCKIDALANSFVGISPVWPLAVAAYTKCTSA